MKTIYARGILIALAYDMSHALDNGTSPKLVANMAKKKIAELERKNNYIKVVWD